jgi:hypothetical protein
LVAEHALDYFLVETAILQRVVRAMRQKLKRLQLTRECLHRDTKAVRSQDQVPGGEPAFLPDVFFKHSAHGDAGHEEGGSECVREYIVGVLSDFAEGDAWLTPSGEEMRKFVRQCPSTTSAPVQSIEQYARAQFVMECVDTGNRRGQGANENPESKLELEDSDEIGDRAEAETQTRPQLCCQLLGLLVQTTAADLALGRVVDGRYFVEAPFEFDVRRREVVQQCQSLDALSIGLALASRALTSKLSDKIDSHSGRSQERVNACAIKLG